MMFESTYPASAAGVDFNHLVVLSMPNNHPTDLPFPHDDLVWQEKIDLSLPKAQ